MMSSTESHWAGQRDSSLAHNSDICESKQKGSEDRIRTLTVARFSVVFVLAMAICLGGFHIILLKASIYVCACALGNKTLLLRSLCVFLQSASEFPGHDSTACSANPHLVKSICLAVSLLQLVCKTHTFIINQLI